MDASQATHNEMQSMEGVYMEEVYLGLTTSHLVALPNGEQVVVREMSMDSPTRLSQGSEIEVG